MKVAAEVVRLLERAGVRHALVGAAALAAHGVSRSTSDVDLFTVDVKVLDGASWEPLASRGIALRLLKGDHEDPLAGTVRLSEGDEIVDVVVGRLDWQREVIESAEPLSLGGLRVPVVRPAGLILLKLYAGGPRDAWDVQSLLEALDDPAAVAAEVEATLARLPPHSRRLWSRLRSGG